MRSKLAAEQVGKTLTAIKDVHDTLDEIIVEADGVFDLPQREAQRATLAELHDSIANLDNLIEAEGDVGGQRSARIAEYTEEARQLLAKIAEGK